jgi:hypothetical protein
MTVARSEAEAQVAAARLSEAEKHAVPSGDYLLSPGDAVLVLREKNGWQGPATFLDLIGGNVRVSINRNGSHFQHTLVNPATALSKESIVLRKIWSKEQHILMTAKLMKAKLKHLVE